MSTPSVSRPLPLQPALRRVRPRPRRRRRRRRGARRRSSTSSSTVPLPRAPSSRVDEPHLDALASECRSDEPAPDVLTEDAGERRGQSLDDRHLRPGLAGGGGDLLADEPGADDRQAGRPALKLGAQAASVGEGAKLVYVRVALRASAAAWRRCRSRSAACRRRARCHRRGRPLRARPSSRRARRPRISSTRLSSYQDAERKATSPSSSLPASSSLDSGGRSYGASGSPQTMRIRPS